MDIRTASNLALQLMAQHGLLMKGWSFEYDSANRRFGACHYRTRKITLSRALVAINSEEQVRDTILHEIAHALAPTGAGHGPLWKAVCIRIGAKPERCYKTSEVNTVSALWKAACGKCGHVEEIKCHRNPAPNGMACKPCFTAARAVDNLQAMQQYSRYKIFFRKLENIIIPAKKFVTAPTFYVPVAAQRPAVETPVPVPAAQPVVSTIKFNADEAVRLYQSGMKVVDIAVRFGYARGQGQNRTRAALVKAGVYQK